MDRRAGAALPCKDAVQDQTGITRRKQLTIEASTPPVLSTQKRCSLCPL